MFELERSKQKTWADSIKKSDENEAKGKREVKKCWQHTQISFKEFAEERKKNWAVAHKIYEIKNFYKLKLTYANMGDITLFFNISAYVYVYLYMDMDIHTSVSIFYTNVSICKCFI